MELALKYMDGVKLNKNSLGTYQLSIGGRRMRGVHGKKGKERECESHGGENEPWARGGE